MNRNPVNGTVASLSIICIGSEMIITVTKRKNYENQTFPHCSLIRPDIITKLSTPFTITLKMNVQIHMQDWEAAIVENHSSRNYNLTLVSI